MLRFGLVLMAVALTASTVGCVHCDTCDDFPTPCVGPNCGYSGGVAPTGTYSTPATAVVPNAMNEAVPAPAPQPGQAPIDTGETASGAAPQPTEMPPPTVTNPAPGAETSPPAPMNPGGPAPFSPRP